MNTSQAASALGIGQNAILDAIKRGTLKAVKVGREWDIPETEVERYKREHLGRQGRVSKAAATDRANRGVETKRLKRLSQQEPVRVPDEYKLLFSRFSDMLARAEGTPPEVVTTPAVPSPAPPATPVPGELPDFARWVRRAELVILRLETVATRLEIASE